MNRRDYLVEAAEALEAPGEIWLFPTRSFTIPPAGNGVLAVLR